MSDYTATEVESAIENDGYTIGDYDAETYWGELAWQDEGTKFTLPLRGETVEGTLVAADPGGEGHGENVSLVLGVGDQLFEKTGYYASHYGTDWDGAVTEVKPVQKMITVYEAV